MKRYFFLLLPAILVLYTAQARERIRFDENWEFAFGNASSPALDFGCGTEYFNYLTKAASIHNEGPYSLRFDKTKWPARWKAVTLPHDWVVDLPYAPEASHSHGYKTVGFKYPETSVGWYRKTFTIAADEEGKHITIRFDGIFRNARIWVNGFYLGGEPSGYAAQVYDISEYLNYGEENLVCARVDATLEEGWFYEGAGIYRHVWLEITDTVHVAPFGTFVHSAFPDGYDKADITVETCVRNSSNATSAYSLRHTLQDKNGKVIRTVTLPRQIVPAKADSPSIAQMEVEHPHLWSPSDPYLYNVRTEVLKEGKTVDCYETVIGLREAVVDKDRGFLLNGVSYPLRGVARHQDRLGVGNAISKIDMEEDAALIAEVKLALAIS